LKFSFSFKSNSHAAVNSSLIANRYSLIIRGSSLITPLYPSLVSKTVIAVVADNDMVKQRNIKKCSGITDFFGQPGVGFAGFKVPGGMVVAYDN
jgi:hypothetical protein